MVYIPRTAALCIAVLIPFAGLAQSPPDGHRIEDLSHPESVTAAPDGNTFYAANIGTDLAPTAKDGDGFITRLDGTGAVATRRFLPADADDATLHAPKGTVVVNGRLYTADVDRIVGFDLDTRRKVAEISLREAGVSFLNALAVKDEQTLFASATNQGTVYRIDLASGTATALEANVPRANGVAYAPEPRTLYAVTYGGEHGGQLRTLSLTNAGTVAETTTRTLQDGGRFDGLVRHNGALLISSWGVKKDDSHPPALYRIKNAGTGAVTTTPLAEWQGPADFDCTSQRGCWIPNLPGTSVGVVHPSERIGNSH